MSMCIHTYIHTHVDTLIIYLVICWFKYVFWRLCIPIYVTIYGVHACMLAVHIHRHVKTHSVHEAWEAKQKCIYSMCRTRGPEQFIKGGSGFWGSDLFLAQDLRAVKGYLGLQPKSVQGFFPGPCKPLECASPD